mgnify:CR=1 FL=1
MFFHETWHGHFFRNSLTHCHLAKHHPANLFRNSASSRATPKIERAVISRRACGELPQRALLGPTRITAYSPEFYEAWHEHISITERPYGREAPAGGGVAALEAWSPMTL